MSIERIEGTGYLDDAIHESVSPESIQIAHSIPVIPEKTSIFYKQIETIDLDIDFDFQLKTASYNKLVELANPILSVALRMKKLDYFDDIPGFYQRMQNEITAIAEEVKELEYDSAFQLSFRYCLCTFIDETIMATNWGCTSVWAERSLLSYFHNETWGGEKFYSILSRLMLEPQKYQELLEFMYICLILGFKGQYGMTPQDQEKIQGLIIKLQKTLRGLRGNDYIRENSINIYKRDYTVKQHIPLWGYFAGTACILVTAFLLYSTNLGNDTLEITQNINELIRK